MNPHGGVTLPPEPWNLRDRPHVGGLPVPANTLKDANGNYDFAIIDYPKAIRMAQRRRCAMCGKGMTGRVAFIGARDASTFGAFVDGPMHPSCARFASKVCPYINGTRRRYRDEELARRRHGEDYRLEKLEHEGNPDVMEITLADSYRIVDRGQTHRAERGGKLYLPERNITKETIDV